MTDDPARHHGEGFTVKEIVLGIERDLQGLSARLDGYIAIHEVRHVAEQAAASDARSQPRATAAGQALLDDIGAVADAHRETRGMVIHHDKLIQRLIGATALASFLGLGTLGLVVARLVLGI